MQLIGHRGSAHLLAPENSLPAVERALLQGADGVEVDVRLTADGVPVCHHDESLWRTAGDRRYVSSLTYRELAAVGSHRIPLLSEVIDLVGSRGRLIIDVKTRPWPSGAAIETVESIAAVLRRQRLDHVTVSSFDRPRILQLRSFGVEVRTALLGRAGVPLGVVLRRALADGHHEAHPHVSALLAHPDLIEPAVSQGLSITGWTVNSPTELRLLADAGLPAVICDDPAAARHALALVRVSA